MAISRGGFAAEIKADESVSAGTVALAGAAGDLQAALDDAGLSLALEAAARFEAERGPDGAPWAPLSQTTLLLRRRRMLAKEIAQSRAKTDKGRAAAKTKAATKVDGLLAAAKILQQDGHLKGGVSHRVGADFLEVGTDRVYGRIQHLGGETKGFIKGRIPARPFLPDFAAGSPDTKIVIEAIEAHLARVAS